ncbi:MAG: type II secretion system protein GspD [Bythopirellula sp.]
MLPLSVAEAQLPDIIKEFLPKPPTAQQVAPQGLPRREVIPLARPADDAEIVVEEQGEGLISLKVRDASLRQVVAMIAETQRINIVFSSPEDVAVTGALNRVHWQQALETLLASTGHTWTDDQGIIVVTSLASADLIAPRAGGRHVETFELDFAKAVDIDQAVKGLLSPAGNSWVLESSNVDNKQSREVVVVVDFPGNLHQIADYICKIDQPPRQVLIKANILQVDLKDDCRSGVNIQQLISFSGNEIDYSTVGFANPAATTANFIQVTGSALNGLVELLKNTTDAKSLASTELLAVSGQEARLQSGQQLGFRVTTTTQTSTLESVEFIDVGVVLTMTPHVTRDGRVLMRIKPEVSEGQVDPETGLPAEDTVEVETDVLLNNGQGLVIGGLIQEVDSNVQSKVPWLGDLPYAGILFQKRQVVKARAEIIVTLIPHVMPYTPIDIAHNDHRMMRTQQPLMSPPLNRFPRPYEARLPDTFYNPTPLCPHRHCQVAAHPVKSPVIAPTPTFEFPQPRHEQGPLCYPPEGSQQPLLVPQQAGRGYPIYR